MLLIAGTAGQINVITEIRFTITCGASGTTTTPASDLSIKQSTNLNHLQSYLPRNIIGQIATNTTSASSLYYRDTPAGGRVFDVNKPTNLGVPTGFVLPTKITNLTIQLSYKEIIP